jgi:hypothetical protein
MGYVYLLVFCFLGCVGNKIYHLDWNPLAKQIVISRDVVFQEDIALSDAAKEAIFLCKLLDSLSLIITCPTLVHTDSKSTLDHDSCE